METILIIGVALAVVSLVLLVVVLVVVLRGRDGKAQAEQAEALSAQLQQAQLLLDAQKVRLELLDADFARIDSLTREEFGRSREESLRQQQATREESQRQQLAAREENAKQQKDAREENSVALSKIQQTMTEQLTQYRETLDRQLTVNRETTEKQLTATRETMDKQLNNNRETVEQRLTQLQKQNSEALEQMRLTVDEKLQETVNKRFNDSFKMISERLEQVQKGLGEMQQLASGVSDLKKVLSNVKTRGNLGEYQLGAILEQVLSPEQYIANAQVKLRSQERVEFAVVMPGKTDTDNLLLPIDSKFPVEDYERLLEAYDGEGEESVETIAKRLELRIKSFARDIRDKYINPPQTTDFAIMFVPTEGLYAEVLRRPALFEQLQREYHVTVVGPTNLVAFLSSLQMGFRTLAIEKRSSEVWKILGAVKTEFTKFEGMLEGVQKKLDAASKDIDRIKSKSNNINRKMGKVQELPTNEAAGLLGSGSAQE